MSQLRTFHPYLEPLHFLFEAYLSSPSSSSTLLLSVVLYLASLSLPPDQAATNLRTTLTPYIISLRDTIMLQLPESFLALKALDLLLTHAPLGALPLQLINPRLIGVAAGQSLAATHISESLAFPMLFKQINRGHCIGAWDSTDVWLYISLRAAEASIALEAEVTKRPAGLSEARDLAEAMMAAENADTWRRGLEVRDPAEALGKLAVCDRLARLGQVHDGIARIRGAMDAAAAEPNLDLVEAVVEELKYHSGRLEAIDSRFDALLGK